MTQLTKNFKRSEFSCKCGCGHNTVDYELLMVCQEVADYFQDVVKVNSGCRCAEHNATVGGSKNSKHLLGRAADLSLKHTDPDKVQAYLQGRYPESYGIGTYDSFTHIDTRDTKARWGG